VDLGEFKDIELDIYHNPLETYLIAQIRISNFLPIILDRHINYIKEGNDLNMVLESLEWEIYQLKKKVYVNIKEWDHLLNYLSDYRILEIENNPKGPGDLIIKDLIWIREYESKLHRY
jgi:MerR family transcriptional regulator, copper efflux regulator